MLGIPLERDKGSFNNCNLKATKKPNTWQAKAHDTLLMLLDIRWNLAPLLPARVTHGGNRILTLCLQSPHPCSTASWGLINFNGRIGLSILVRF